LPISLSPILPPHPQTSNPTAAATPYATALLAVAALLCVAAGPVYGRLLTDRKVRMVYKGPLAADAAGGDAGSGAGGDSAANKESSSSSESQQQQEGGGSGGGEAAPGSGKSPAASALGQQQQRQAGGVRQRLQQQHSCHQQPSGFVGRQLLPMQQRRQPRGPSRGGRRTAAALAVQLRAAVGGAVAAGIR